MLIDELSYGVHSARRARFLAQACETSDRELRRAIRELIAGGVPVASSTQGVRGGYFIANSQQEAKGYLAELRSRVIEDCKRMRDFKFAAKALLYPGQLPLI